MDSVARFSNRVDNYAEFRPSYPAGVIDVLTSECGLNKSSIIADVGSGTGLLSELFLKNGNPLYAVEPNRAMRLFAENFLRQWPNFVSVAAPAEETTLRTSSVDFITAGQAFHWFDQQRAKREFTRILKPSGWVVLIWNERRLDSTAFLRDYEELLLRYGTDYEKVRHENVTGGIARFFAPEAFELKTLENAQNFDLESLKGRTRSSSYTPEPGSANFEPLFAELENIFNQHACDGTVTFEYDTTIYYGHLSPSSNTN